MAIAQLEVVRGQGIDDVFSYYNNNNNYYYYYYYYDDDDDDNDYIYHHHHHHLPAEVRQWKVVMRRTPH